MDKVTSTDALDPVTIGLPASPLTAARNDAPSVYVRARLDEQLRALLTSESIARTGADPEGVHQMRVAVRRMRAAIKADGRHLPDGVRLQTELRWLGSSLGAVRDLDVLLDHIHDQAGDFDDADAAAVEQLVAGLVDDRRAARQRMLTVLRGRRYRALRVALAAAVTSPVAEVVDEDGPEPATLVDVVHKPLRKLVRKAGKLGEDPPDDDLHELRIYGKRLRYAAELAEPAKPKKVGGLIRATKRLQEILGDHQDAVVAEEQIRRLLADLGPAADTRIAFVAGRLVERERAKRAEQRAAWRTAVDEVAATGAKISDQAISA